MGATLEELIGQHAVEMTAVYTHSEEGDGSRSVEHDVYDCFLTIEGDTSLYGDRSNARTMLVRGFGQSYSNSRPQNGDVLIPPTLANVLDAVLSDAIMVDSWSTFEEWAGEHAEKSFEGGLRAHKEYEEDVRLRNDLARFLGDAYESFKDASMEH